MVLRLAGVDVVHHRDAVAVQPVAHDGIANPVHPPPAAREDVHGLAHALLVQRAPGHAADLQDLTLVGHVLRVVGAEQRDHRVRLLLDQHVDEALWPVEIVRPAEAGRDVVVQRGLHEAGLLREVDQRLAEDLRHGVAGDVEPQGPLRRYVARPQRLARPRLRQRVMLAAATAQRRVDRLGRAVEAHGATERRHRPEQGQRDAALRAQRHAPDLALDRRRVQQAGEEEAQQHGQQRGAGGRPATPGTARGRRPVGVARRPAALRDGAAAGTAYARRPPVVPDERLRPVASVPVFGRRRVSLHRPQNLK